MDALGIVELPGLRAQGIGFRLRKERELLHGKGTEKPRRPAGLLKGSLDEQRSRATARIMQGKAGPPG